MEFFSRTRTFATRTFVASLLLAAAVHNLAGAAVHETIDQVLHDPYLKNVTVGIKIIKLGDTSASSKSIYERDPTRPMTPASNFKLLTTAAALDTLGPDFQFETKLMQKGQTLALVGDGDPSLGDSELLGKVGWKSTTEFEKWAAGLIARGVKSADKLVYDDSIFDGPYVHADWPQKQILQSYMAGVAGLNFNANCLNFYLKPQGAGNKVQFETDPPTSYGPITNTCVQGTKNAAWISRTNDASAMELRGSVQKANVDPISVTVDNPPLFTATVLCDVLTKGGMNIGGEVTRDPTVRGATDWQTLAIHQTPIATVLQRANKDSMNMYAEALSKRLGAKESGVGNWKTGPAAVGTYLKSLGIDEREFTLHDGCGLSKYDLVSPAALVAVLEHEYFAAHHDVFLSSLAVAGIDGTLRERFEGTSLRQRVIGKSGFIEGVSALSGFLKAKDGNMYAFSILFNGIPKLSNSNAKKLQERIVMAIEQ